MVRYTLVQDVCHLVMRCLLETEAADRRREVSTVKKDLSGGKDIPIAVYVGRDGRKGC